MRHVEVVLISSNTSDECRAARGIIQTHYEGVCTLGPSIGQPFHFFFDRNGGKNYDTDFYTSPVKSIQFSDTVKQLITVKTKNSVYNVILGSPINE